MTRLNIQKFAWILFLLGLGCRTNFNDFDRRIYVVEGLKKQNPQEEKISEQRKHPKHTQLPLVTIQEGIGIPDLLLKKPSLRTWNPNSEISILETIYI